MADDSVSPMGAADATVRAPLEAAQTALLEIGAVEETVRLRIHDASSSRGGDMKTESSTVDRSGIP